MVGVKGYDSEILEALKRHKVWIIAKTSNANTITHYLKGSMKAIKRVEADLSNTFPSAGMSLRKVALVSAIGRDLGSTRVLGQAMRALADADIEPLGVHDLLRKVDLQIIVEPDQFEDTIVALHKGLIEDWATEAQPKLHAVA
jgi:aspartate kinase